MKIIAIFLNGILFFFLHNMIPRIILHENVLRLNFRKINNLRDILYFILSYFDMKCKISRKLFIFW